jgi:hypothetical protein
MEQDDEDTELARILELSRQEYLEQQRQERERVEAALERVAEQEVFFFFFSFSSLLNLIVSLKMSLKTSEDLV